MDREEAARAHRSLVRELTETEQQLDEVQQRVDALRKLVDGYEGLFPDLKSDGQGKKVVRRPKPKGRTAVLRVLGDASDKFTVKQVTQALEERGWAPKSEDPEAVVRTTLARLSRDGRVEKAKLDGRSLVYWLAETESE